MPSNYSKICEDNIHRRGNEFDDIGRLISEQLYSDKSHFVYELLQNAEDALERRFRQNPNDNSPRAVQFKLFRDRLEFRHFGAPFNEKDVKGVSDVLKGTKTGDFIQIGKFGIGFKSVYAFTASPEIHSGDEHFVIKRYIRPEAKNSDHYPSMEPHETVFVFPFDHEKLPEDQAFKLILKKLQGLGPRVLLFLRQIDEIEWSVDSDEEKGQYLKETKPIQAIENARHVTVIGQKNDEDENEDWRIFKRPVTVSGESGQVSVEIAFRLGTNTEDNRKSSIVRENNTPLVVYFPTEKDTRLGFLLQGSYRTTPARDNILQDDEWNKRLIKETAGLVIGALRQLKQMGLLSVSVLETLPIRVEDFPKDNIFYPIFAKVKEALMNDELLPANGDTFVAARNAKLVRGTELTKLLDPDQLRALFRLDGEIKWLSTNITEDRTPDLRSYLMKELEIEEVTPDSFAREITRSFLKAQTDEWFIKFYKYLSNQETLWRAPRGRWSQAGILRTKPILRLQDDSQKTPFRPDGTTQNAYLPPPEETDFPIVKRTIVNSEQARNFLKELGLSEPDVFDDIVERVFPKYTIPDVNAVPQEEHAADIQKILRAMASDSEKGKEKVIRAAPQTPFLKAVDSSGTEVFKKPIEIYRDTANLRRYFSASTDVWFLCEQQSGIENGNDAWRKLGVEYLPRRIPFSGGLPDEEQKPSTRPEIVENYKLHGLENFLESLRNSEGFGDKEKLAFVLWEFLKVHLELNPRFFKGRHEWFYYTEHSKSFNSNILTCLQSVEWIPTKQGSLQKPGSLTTDQLPDIFNDADELIDALGINQSEERRHADALDVTLEDIEFLKSHRDEFERLKEKLAAGTKPIFPTKPVKNPERRKKQLAEQYANSPDKKYEVKERSVRTTENVIDPHQQLKERYTNNENQMVCQICKEEMPFKKRDGEYYFEAVEALSEKYLPKEHEAQFLALCPLCSAMFKEFVKHDDKALEKLYEALKSSNDLELPLKLGKEETSVQFVTPHRQDIHTILNTGEEWMTLGTAINQEPAPPTNLASAIRARFAPLGGVELDLPSREPMREPPHFD